MGYHKISGISGGRDENGIITITQPWHADTLEECFTMPGETPIAGLPEVGRRLGTWDPDTVTNGYQVGISYQGRDTKFPEKESETYDLDSEFSEQPVERFHELEELKANWGARIEDVGGEKKVLFDEILTTGSGTGEGAGGFAKGEKSAAGRPNPLFGLKTFPRYESVWIHTYVRKSMPGNLLDRVGLVVKRPPGNPPTPEGRDWKLLPPLLQVFKGEGGCRITDRYVLSPPKGWPAIIGDITII